MSVSDNMKGVKRIIAVHSAKGGVGKSTIAVNLATGLAKTGASVGLLDADIHGPSGSIMMGTGEWPDQGPEENSIFPIKAHGIKFISMGNLVTKSTPLIWRGAMVHSVIAQFFNNVIWGDLDYLILDMPPGTGDAQISISQLVKITGVVVVSSPQELSLVDTIRGINAFQKLQVPILGMIENMSYFVCDGCDDRAYLFGESGAEILGEEMGFSILGKVPIEPEICASGDAGTPFVLSHPDSPSSRVISSIVDRLLVSLESKTSSHMLDIQWEQLNWDERRPEPSQVDESEDAPVRAIWQVSSDELGINWNDKTINTYAAAQLRRACPCAACIDEWSGKPLLDPSSIPADINFKEIRTVGRYAINPVFSDGHSSGIFHFERLQAIANARPETKV